MRITGVINQKGGVGKTAVVAGVAGALAERGQRVLAGDLDPQGHLTVTALKLARVPVDQPSLAAALAGDYDGPTSALVTHHSITEAGGRLDLLPTSIRMWTAVRDLDKRPDRERQLGRLLDDLAGDYDHVLLDAPPALDILTDNILAAVDGVLIPVQPEDSSLEALRLLLGQIRALERALRRPPVQLHGLVASLYRRPLSTIDGTVMDRLSEIDGLPILGHFPLAVVIKEAWRAGQPVPIHASNTEAANAYRTLADVLDAATDREMTVQ
ncbi:MAG: ParA family protein [Pseudonocardiaceae bacterium]